MPVTRAMEEQFQKLLAAISAVTAGQEEMKEAMAAGQEEMKEAMAAGQEEMKGAVTAVQEEMKAGQEEVKRAIDAVTAGQEEMKNELNSVKGAVEERLTAIEDRVTAVEKQVEERVSAVSKDVEQQIVERVSAIAKEITSMEKQIEERVNTVSEKVEYQVEERVAAIAKEMENLKRSIMTAGSGTDVKFLPMTSRTAPKLSTYDGKSSWQVYKTQFSIVADANGWDPETKACHLAASLRADAADILQTLSENQRRDFEALSSALELRFGEKCLKEYSRLQLKSRQQHYNFYCIHF